ncbi:MAG: hypothetical protein QGI21_05420 [Candidatus Poseidoniaceae archaeon]|jgi:hypothetical protein|nr:hypothetical protein [Candidatus Poseidoniaceae archaeon]
MGKLISHTARIYLDSSNIENSINKFRTPSTWPEWNRNAKSLIATKAESLDEGDHLALHQVIKGSVIESRWEVGEIKEDINYTEIILLGVGQSRNERPIASGLDDLKIIFTFLNEEGGGVEIHASCEISGFLVIFSSQIKNYMEVYCNDLLEDISNIN